MRKVFLLVVAITALCFTSNGQIYIDANLGYNFGMNGNYNLLINQTETMIIDFGTGFNQSTLERESVGLSLGKGMSFGVTVGYDFSRFIAAELGFGFLLGGGTEAINKSVNRQLNNGVVLSETVSESTIEYKGRSLQFVPSVVISPGFKRGINPYARIGLLIGVNSFRAEQSANENFFGTPMATTSESKYTGGVTLGALIRPGVRFEVGDNIFLFAELSFNSSTYKPKRGEVTEYKVNGEDRLPDLPTNQKEVEFDDEVTYNFTSPEDPNKPAQQTKISIPFSSVGFLVGAKFTLGR